MASPSSPSPTPDSNEPRYLLGIRQTPHYRPLSHKPTTVRSNLIPAYDKAFLDVATRIRTLPSHKDFEKTHDELRSTLSELEAMGYDVGPLARRLEVLENAAESALVMSDATRAKIAEANRKVEEKTGDLEGIREEIARLQAKAVDKQQGIDELVTWVENLRLKTPDFDTAFVKLAKAPLV